MNKLLYGILVCWIPFVAGEVIQHWHLNADEAEITILSDDELQIEMPQYFHLSSSIRKIILVVTETVGKEQLSEEFVQLANYVLDGDGDIPYPTVFIGIADALALLRNHKNLFATDYYAQAEKELQVYMKKIAINKELDIKSNQ